MDTASTHCAQRFGSAAVNGSRQISSLHLGLGVQRFSDRAIAVESASGMVISRVMDVDPPYRTRPRSALQSNGISSLAGQ